MHLVVLLFTIQRCNGGRECCYRELGYLGLWACGEAVSVAYHAGCEHIGREFFGARKFSMDLLDGRQEPCVSRWDARLCDS